MNMNFDPTKEYKPHGACYDCDRRYGDKYGFPDLLVPDNIWEQISPTGGEGGLLCPCCIIKRMVALGLSTTEARFVSGPLVIE